MKLQFLCPTHRQQLSINPSYAISCWQTGIDTAKSLIDTNQWYEALTQIGCAFESSEIIMTSDAIAPHHACEIFTSSAIKLASLFVKTGQNQHAEQVYSLTTNRLSAELTRKPECSEIIKHLSNEITHRAAALEASVNNQFENRTENQIKRQIETVH